MRNQLRLDKMRLLSQILDHTHLSVTLKGTLITTIPLVVGIILSFVKIDSGVANLHCEFQKTWNMIVGVLQHSRLSLRNNLLSWIPRTNSAYSKFPTVEAEIAYWEQAAGMQRVLSFSDARGGSVQKTSGATKSAKDMGAPVLYYEPRLLPDYRDRQTGRDPNSTEYRIPTKAFVHWHHLVFPERIHPTLAEASEIMKRLSNRDLRQMYKMSRRALKTENLAGCVEVGFNDQSHGRQSPCLDNKHRRKWEKWLLSKGPDVAIIFEGEEEELDDLPV